MGSEVSQCITPYITVIYIHTSISVISPQFDLSRPHKCTFSCNNRRVIFKKLEKMYIYVAVTGQTVDLSQKYVCILVSK